MKTIQKHFKEHEKVLLDTKILSDSIAEVSIMLVNALKNDRAIFWCGNGGSESDSHHLSGELIGRFIGNRRPLKSIALHSGGAEGSCISNDFGYDAIFSRQIDGLANDGDILVAITTSGNSKNIYNAIKVAKKKNMKIIGLLGKDGGTCLELCDLSILIPSKTTARIQEMHILVGHTLCEGIELGLGLV